MQSAVFDSKLLVDGRLYCPKEFANPNAKFKVVVTFPDEAVEESDLDIAAVNDADDDLLTKEEIDYYLNLEDIE